MKRFFLNGFLICLLLCGFDLKAAITTPQILASSISPACADPCLVGVCFWLRCDLLGCRTETTVRWQHKQPDLVVSAYRDPGTSPWLESRPLGLAALTALQQSTGQNFGGGQAGSIRENPAEQHNLQFFEIDAIGHPFQAGNLVTNVAQGLGIPYACPSEAVPFTPYFISIADAVSWRSPASEYIYPQSFVPGLREIGPWPLSSWGSVFPRHGFVIQTDPVKAAAVMSQRAVDIVTNITPNHIAAPLIGDLPRHVDPPGPADEKQAQWQMIYPKLDLQCQAFGADPFYEQGRQSEEQTYVWNYWQPYQCCTDNPGAVYLFSVQIEPVCLLGGAS